MSITFYVNCMRGWKQTKMDYASQKKPFGEFLWSISDLKSIWSINSLLEVDIGGGLKIARKLMEVKNPWWNEMGSEWATSAWRFPWRHDLSVGLNLMLYSIVLYIFNNYTKLSSLSQYKTMEEIWTAFNGVQRRPTTSSGVQRRPVASNGVQWRPTASNTHL